MTAETNTTIDPAPSDGLREALHGMWASVAPSWEANAAFIDARGAALTQAMLDLARPQPGERLLELACGPGGLGLAAAPLVQPGGEVVLSDVAAEMTAVAADRAAARGLTNVSTRELDLENIDEPDGAFDAVLCREGLMLVPDPRRAAREMSRVLCADGRVAVAVWGSQAQNPWLGILFDAVSADTGTSVPPPGIPGPFSLPDAGDLGATLEDAGLHDVVVGEVEASMHASSFDVWWGVVSSLAGPLALVLASLPADDIAAIRASAEAALDAYRTPDGFDLPGVSLVAGGRRSC